MSVVRGRPPGLAGGIRGASRAYCSSLSPCPAPKSPTKARFSAVHMACLQEGLHPSLNRRHDHYASSSLSPPRGLLKRSLRRRKHPNFPAARRPIPRHESADQCVGALERRRLFKHTCALRELIRAASQPFYEEFNSLETE